MGRIVADASDVGNDGQRTATSSLRGEPRRARRRGMAAIVTMTNIAWIVGAGG
jgi:hypothetical protein